jgi:hypothetical protein
MRPRWNFHLKSPKSGKRPATKVVGWRLKAKY